MAIDFDRMTEGHRTKLDAIVLAQQSPWWDSFYEDRTKPCPFFGTSPDESLAEWVSDGLIQPGRAVDLGCGNARNAVFLARHRFSVEGVDHSRAAIEWASDRVEEAGVSVALRHQSVFELELDAGSYDLVYDSGCFHHIPPHRRNTYVDLVTNALKPGGWFGLTCFRPEGGSGYSDDEVYERRSMGGGLGYTASRLTDIWCRNLQVRVIRQMKKISAGSELFGQDFLWVLLAQRT